LLSADRPFAIGYGATATGQIPFPSICAFADRYGVGVDQFERFVRVLRLVDAALVSDINIRANKKP